MENLYRLAAAAAVSGSLLLVACSSAGAGSDGGLGGGGSDNLNPSSGGGTGGGAIGSGGSGGTASGGSGGAGAGGGGGPIGGGTALGGGSGTAGGAPTGGGSEGGGGGTGGGLPVGGGAPLGGGMGTGGGAPVGGGGGPSGTGTGGGGPLADIVFFDNFEGGLGNWSATNGVWEVGVPTSGPAAAYSGSNVAATVLAGDYPKTTSSLASPSIALPTISANEELHLRYWHWFSLAGSPYMYDRATVGLQEQTAPGVWGPATTLASHPGVSGGVWTRPVVDLSAFSGKKVRLLFSLVPSGWLAVSSGWYVDDVSVTVVQASSSAPFEETFEEGLGNWWADNGTWQVRAPTSGPSACHGGGYCAATDLPSTYQAVNSDFVTPSIVLPNLGAGEELQLRFWHWFSFTSGQGAVYIQEQTSPSTWTSATNLTSFSGTSGGIWTRPMVDLSAYGGKKVRILFGFSNSGYGVSSGWYIDDVTVDVLRAGVLPR